MTDRSYRLGVVFPASADPADLPAFAVRVEELGFDTLWVIEDCFLSGGLTMAATALAVTESIGVGVGLLPAPVRNPAIVAMEIATLGRMHPGRFEATLGHGVAEWMEQIGALPARRLAALGETATAVRALLAGETVTMDGTHVKLSGVTLGQPPQVVPPVLIGTTGPKGLAVAGRHADGILLPEGSGPAFVKWAVAQTSATAAARCVVYSWFSVDDDPDHARARLMPAIDHWLQSDLFPHAKRAAGVTGPLAPGDPARPALADAISVCGDVEMCADNLRRLAAAGAGTIVLAAPGDELDGQLERFARDVMPLLATAERTRGHDPYSGRRPTSHERGAGVPWDASYLDGPAPWDVGPQPAVLRLASEGAFAGAVLDAGCGTGENALHVASLGLHVLGVDVAGTAVSIARKKAADRGLDAEFEVADALHLDRLGRVFETVLDCGLFHTFDDDERRDYVAALASVTGRGGALYVLCFSDRGPGDRGPHPVSEEELRASFGSGDGWSVASVTPDRIQTRFSAQGPPAWLAKIERT